MQIVNGDLEGPISEACIFAPKLKSKDAKQLALDLFLGGNQKEQRRYCYIRYSQLIRELKQRFHQQQAKLPKPDKTLAYHN